MKIKKIDIEAFRGIPNNTTINFYDKSGECCSTIIYGGNGSGKSTIIDAIEYNLQSRLERSPKINNPKRPFPINFCNKHAKNSIIKITFDDDSENIRSINISYDSIKDRLQYERNPVQPHYNFSNVPVVLRRNDIIAYNNTSELERQKLIYQFIYKISDRFLLENDPVILEIKNEIRDLKSQRRESISRISELTTINAADLTKYLKDINGFVRNRITYRNDDKLKIRVGKKLFFKILEEVDNVVKYNKLINEKQCVKKEKIGVPKTGETVFSQLDSFYEKAGYYLSTAFKEIAKVDYVNSIKLSIGKISTASLNIEVKLTNGKKVTPQSIFSEANYDLMILLLYLSIIRVGVDYGQEKIIILDDVLQSVDSGIRAIFINYLLREFNDWQIFITCHDRLWLNQLRYLFQRVGHKYKEFHITNWSFEVGPNIQEFNYHTCDNTLKQALATNNIRIIASTSGLFLEKICQELSMNLGCSVSRKKDDKYTIGDLWPSIKKTLKKTHLSAIMDEIDKLLYIRNLLGCHYNEWSEALNDIEVYQFANAIQVFYEKTFCSSCCKWISSSNSLKNYECPCKKLSY